MIINKIIKEYERFLKKIIKKFWLNSNLQGKERILREVLGMEQPVIGFHDNFLSYKYTKNDLELLKNNLDDESQNLIDLILNRIYSPFGKAWFIDRNDIFTEEELKMQNTDFFDITSFGELKYNPDLEKFRRLNLQESVYRYHNGLTFLPIEALEQIKNRAVIDGGAYIGDSAFIFLDYDPSCVYSFEPCSKNFDNLQKNIADKNCQDKIKPVKLGLGESKTILKASGEGAAFSLLSDDNSNSEQIEITTIDDYVAENNIDVGLIKLDVEGFELETLKSSINTLKQHKPVLLISLYHTPKDFFGIKPFLEDLDIGYNFMVRKLINHYSTFEMTLICF